METIDIKGKPYVMVNERLKYFWIEEGGSRVGIRTEFIELTPEWCVMKASIIKVFDSGEMVVATGHAYEKADSTFINKTSYIENCETSAIGRALGNLGIGIDTSVASAEEVQNAIKQQEKQPSEPQTQEPKNKLLASDEQRKEIRKLATDNKMKDDIDFMNFMRFVSDKYSDYFIDGKISKVGAMWLCNEFTSVLDEYKMEKTLD